MIVSVVLSGSIKTLLRPSQCRHRSTSGCGLVSAGAGLGIACALPCAQPLHLQRCDLDLAVKSHDRRDWRPGKDQNARLLEIGVGLHTADDLMITLYIKGDGAERCTESFQSS